MGAGILYIMAKSPRPGRVKTRLCPPLAARQAAELAGAFAADVLATAGGLGGVEARLALDDAGADPSDPAAARSGGADPPAADLRALARSFGITAEAQGGGDLGARMRRLLERGLAGGAPTVLIGTDSPDLPRELIASAFEALGRVDVVLGPARDGGYVLVGARRAVAGLFEIDPPWGSGRVFEATCEALARTGCTFEALCAWDDVDDAAALGRLIDRLDAGGARVAPATARLLATWRQQGVRF